MVDGLNRLIKAHRGTPVTTITSYLGNVERIESSNSNTITWRRTVAGAVYTSETSKTFLVQGETHKAFIYKDHLGSTDVITDKLGTVIQSMSFDAWGQRRDASTWDPVSDVIKARFNTERTHQGFTGHEQMDEVGLIHMNGRVYDPRLARFLQADPFIQAPGNTQSYNRYSYVWNNPLNATDPSGYITKRLKKMWDNVFRPAFGAVVGVAITAYCTPCSGVWGAMFTGGAAGAAGAAANNGNILQGMLTGAVGGAMLYGVGSSFAEPGAVNAFGRVVSTGAVGGLMAMSQGVRFEHGFAAAGIGSLAGGGATPAGLIRSAVLGGMASEVTGGKFKNGAATAAFSFALRETPNLYKKIVGYELDMGSGGNAVEKGPLGKPVEDANNIGTQGVWKFDKDGRRIVGTFEEGGPLSKFANKIPGINATAGVHDVMQVSMGTGLARDALNVPSMIVAGGLTYTAYASQPLQYLNDQQLIYLSVAARHDDDKQRQVYVNLAAGGGVLNEEILVYVHSTAFWLFLFCLLGAIC